MTEAERLRMHLQALLEEVQIGLSASRNMGGQQVGCPGVFERMPPSALIHLERCCRHALEEKAGEPHINERSVKLSAYEECAALIDAEYGNLSWAAQRIRRAAEKL